MAAGGGAAGAAPGGQVLAGLPPAQRTPDAPPFPGAHI